MSMSSRDADDKKSLERYCQAYLEELYTGATGYINYKRGEKEAQEAKQVYLTYGEILHDAVCQLIDWGDIHENDVFLDLGSGIGKVVMQWFFMTPIHSAYGIEAHQQRHETAKHALKSTYQEMPEMFTNGREVHFERGNICDANFSGATIVFTCSTCFSQELMMTIGQKVNKAKSVRRVMSLTPIHNLKDLKLVETLKLDCTWDTSNCYIYQ